jgi:protein TonB
MNVRTLVRIPFLLLGAAVVNAAMFSAIEFMTRAERLRLTDTTDFDISNFIRVAEQSRDVRSRRDPKAPEKPQQEMQQDMQRLADVSKGGGVGGMALEMPEIDIDVGSGLGGNIAIARERTPLVRIPAEYPTKAAAQGIEGYVIVRFTVTETGAVIDPEVLRSEPPRIFDRSAMRAVSGWKYQPKMQDGKAVRDQVFARIVFKLARD